MAQYLSSSTICWEGLFIDRYIALLDINCLQYLHQKVLYTSLFLRNTYTPKKSQKMCFSCHIVMPPSVAALPSSVVLGCCDPDPLTFGVKQECLLFRHFQRTDGLFGASWQDCWGPVTFKTTIEKKMLQEQHKLDFWQLLACVSSVWAFPEAWWADSALSLILHLNWRECLLLVTGGVMRICTLHTFWSI